MGRLFAVVGPSGSGKDTLIDAARQARTDLVLVRRVITRPSFAGGEDFDGVSEAEFERLATSGAFALHWRANGLRYGLPAASIDLHRQGRDVLFNGSREAMVQAAQLYPDLTVIRICAPSQVLMERLLARGRETREQIEARIARASFDLPSSLKVIDIRNDGALAPAVEHFLAALQPPKA